MKRHVGLLLATASGLWAQGFSVSHYTHLEVSVQGVEVTYILDLREVPTFKMLRDWKLDAKSPQPELEQKAAEQAQEWAKGLEFRAAGKAVQPQFGSAAIRIRAMADGQAVARITSTFELPGVRSPLEFEDHNFPDRPGWKEIVISSKAGAQIITASHDSTGLSNALTDWPDIPAPSPQDLRASVDWRVASSPAVAPRVVPIPQPKPVRLEEKQALSTLPSPPKGDFLSRLLAKNDIGWQWLLLGLVVAFGLGGAHALEPGHGKTIVAAYLVGSRGTMKHAALLGAVVTFTHTISVFLLGLAMLVLAKSIVPDQVIRILEAVSGLSIVVIGAVLFYQRLRQLRHTLAHEHHHHHFHGHVHDHHDHDHGPHGHSHLPEREVTLGSLIALGVSGGLVPCPAALVIMLAAIAFGHVGVGLVLLVAFSLGLAGVLMAVGMMVLYARSWLPNPDATSRHPVLRLVPVLSALIIVCLGLLMTGVSLGWIRPGLSV